MAGVEHLDSDLRAAGLEVGSEPRRLIERDQRVDIAVGQQHAPADERTWGRRLIEDDHRSNQNGPVDGLGSKLEQGGGDVGAIGKSDGDELPRLQLVVLSRRKDEVGEGVRTPDDLGRIEDAFR